MNLYSIMDETKLKALEQHLIRELAGYDAKVVFYGPMSSGGVDTYRNALKGVRDDATAALEAVRGRMADLRSRPVQVSLGLG